MLSQSASSTEYIRVAVASSDNGVAVNPSSDVVQMAIIPAGNSPELADWLSATWETASDTYYARVLVGPDGGVTTLDANLYDVFVRIEDNPETPIRRTGAVWIY